MQFASDHEDARRRDRWAYVVLVVLLVLVSVARLRVLDLPMERDEGEYAYSGQLILDGVPPYKLAYNMKFPGMYYAYAGILAVLGHAPRAIRLGLWLVNAGAIILVFALGRRMLGRVGACVAAAVFAGLSLDLGALGLWAHATHFVVLFSTAGFLVLGLPASPLHWRLFLGGVLLGIAVLMKQHGIVLVALAGFEILWPRADEPASRASTRLARAGILFAGAGLPLAIVGALLAKQGVWDRFFFWTFAYASSYVSQVEWRGIPHNLLSGIGDVTARAGALWALGLVGLPLALFGHGSPRVRMWLLGYFFVSFLAVCPGWYFRPHYFVLLQPATALLAGALASWLVRRATSGPPDKRRMRIACAVALAVTLFGHYAYAERELFTRTGPEICRLCYPAHAFVETTAVAKYIMEHTQATDRIAVIGSEPHIFFLSGRRSASSYIYTYPLVEVHPFAARMQREMIAEIQDARPAMMVFARFPASWGFQPNSDRTIVNWALAYFNKCYQVDSVVDLTLPEAQSYYWGPAEAAKSRPRSYAIVVYRRTADATCTVPL